MQWINIEQNTPEWEQLRLGKITASNFGVVMAEGYNNKGTQQYALQLALERINQSKSNNQIKTHHMKRGHEQEPQAIALYESEYFCDVLGGGFFDCDYYGDSPDGIVGVDGIIEVKSVVAHVHLDNIRRNRYDPTYHWQIIGHLDCSSRDWCDFVSYCADFPIGKQIFVNRVYRRDVEVEIEQLRKKRQEFNALVNKLVDEINSLESA